MKLDGELALIQLRFATDHMAIPWEALEQKRKIAEGAFGIVFEGEYQNQPVALKFVKVFFQKIAT